VSWKHSRQNSYRIDKNALKGNETNNNLKIVLLIENVNLSYKTPALNA